MIFDTKSNQIARIFSWSFSLTFGLIYSPLNSAVQWGNSKEGDEYYDDDEEYYDDEEYGGVSLRCKEKKRENVYTPHPA